MHVGVHVLVLVGVLVLMLVFVLGRPGRIVVIVRVVVRETFAVWHGALLRTVAVSHAPAQRDT
jgi:hypothetical protein